MAIMVSCAPGLRAFWGRYVSKSNVDGTNKSSKVNRDHSLSGNTPRHAGWEGRDEFIGTVPGQSNAYIRMEAR